MHAARHIWQRGEQPLSLADQAGRVGRGLGQHRLAQRGIAGEGVDVTGFDPVEAQTEQQVLADQRGGFLTGLHGHQRYPVAASESI